MPVTRLVAPGPAVVMQAVMPRLARASPQAMKAAPCSCLASTVRIDESYRWSYTGRMWEPGMP